MAKQGFTRRRVMIWGKTYPELSSRHTETVCTGAIDTATGKPLRLYPVPLRYLRGDQQYHLYDVFDIDMIKSSRDPRPEGHEVDAGSMVKIDQIDTDTDEWAGRRQRVFADGSWHFDSVADLQAAQAAGTHSMGVVTPGVIVDVTIKRKPESDAAEHERKWDEVTSQQDLFPKEYRQTFVVIGLWYPKRREQIALL